MLTTADFNEVFLVFDTHKTESLKQKTRQKQQHGKDPIHYEIADNTRINLSQIARSLSPEKTKADLTVYLAGAVLKIECKLS